MPTGTQSNLAALMSHCQRGDEYLVGQMAHTYRWEGGGAAVLGSIQPQPIAHQADGSLALADIEAVDQARRRALRAHAPAVPREHLRRPADGDGLPARRDRARAPPRPRDAPGRRAPVQRGGRAGRGRTAAIRTPRPRAIADLFDSVSVCFSKGLGAPVGSALVGSRELIARAKRVRKMAGGGMRQAGLLAAAALACARAPRRAPAPRTTPTRAASPRAWPASPASRSRRRPATSCSSTSRPRSCRRARRRSWGGEHDSLVDQLRARGVLCTGLYKLRFVTHLDVDAAGVDRAIAEIRRAVGALTPNLRPPPRNPPCRSPTPKR